MNKTGIFGITALLIVGLVATGAFAMGFGGLGKSAGNDAVKTAVQSGDYEAYKIALTERFNSLSARETFDKRVENFKQRQEKITAMQETQQKIEDAISSGDYNAWKSAVSNLPQAEKITSVITKENFAKFVELRNAMKSGDFVKAKQLADEIGLKTPKANFGIKMKHFFREGFGNKRNQQ